MSARLAGYVVGARETSGVGFIRNMTPVEKHAELVYAESLFEKVQSSRRVLHYCHTHESTQALLGILYSGDWLAFIKEACVSYPLCL